MPIRIILVSFFITMFSVMNERAYAQSIPGTDPNSSNNKYTPHKEIPKPIREDRLNALLPIIQGIYSNTNNYYQAKSGVGDTLKYTYRERPKIVPEKAITFQNLDDIATVIDFLKFREAPSIQHPNNLDLPNPRNSAFPQLWPDHINFVLGPGLKGCDSFCRRLLLDSKFASITVLETELSKETSDPIPFKATRYSLDEGACKKHRDGHHLREGKDETLNLPNYSSPSAEPALGLCFDYETIDVPKNGAFVYFNHASPFWPKEFERTHKRIEHVPNPYRATERIVDPKAFEDLETRFSLPFIWHISYEFRVQGLQPKSILAYESACITPHLPIDVSSLNLLLSTHEPPENDKWRWHQKSIFAQKTGFGSSVCTGNRKTTATRLPVTVKNLAANNIYSSAALDELIKGLKDSLQKYKDTADDTHYSYDYSILEKIRKETPTQAQIDALVPVYESMFDNVTTANLAIKNMRQLPEGSLAGHIKSLNRIRDKIAKKSGCNTVGCDGHYYRIYRNGPSVKISHSIRGHGGWNPKTEDEKWAKLAGDGAAIYAAAGPKAVKHLEGAHKKGLGGAVYALGCMGTSSDLLEEYALNTLRYGLYKHQMNSRSVVRHYLSIRHSARADEYKEEFLWDRRARSAHYSPIYYNDSIIRAILAWDNKSPHCTYRDEFY